MYNNEHMKAHHNIKRNEGKTFSITLNSQMEKKVERNKVVAVTKFMNVYIFMFTKARQHK